LLGASASTEIQEKTYHGVVTLNVNGKSNLAVIDGSFSRDLEVNNKNKYQIGDIVTILVDDGNVVNNYKTSGKELHGIEKKYDGDITTVRRNIIQAIYK
jgi:hypothetical protein